MAKFEDFVISRDKLMDWALNKVSIQPKDSFIFIFLQIATNRNFVSKI